MIIGIDLNKRIPFEIEGTTFILKALKDKDKMLIGQGVDVLQKNFDNIGLLERMEMALNKGLAEIKNIEINGKAETFTSITQDVLDMLPMEVKQKLFEKILEINTPQANEIKN